MCFPFYVQPFDHCSRKFFYGCNICDFSFTPKKLTFETNFGQKAGQAFKIATFVEVQSNLDNRKSDCQNSQFLIRLPDKCPVIEKGWIVKQ